MGLEGNEVSGPQNCQSVTAKKEGKQTPLVAPGLGLEQDQEGSHCLWCPQGWLWYPNTAVNNA